MPDPSRCLAPRPCHPIRPSVRSSAPPPYAESALRIQSKRQPAVALDKACDGLKTEGLTVLQYISRSPRDLTSEDMAIIALRVDGGRTCADVAECLGVSDEAVRRRLQRIMKKTSE